MNPRLAAIVILPVLLHLHLRITAAGTTVALSLPWVIPAALAATAAVLLVISWRSVRGFRSSPYPRTRVRSVTGRG
jgi:membrane protein implicated in regulation of membrane protease activity